MAARLATLPAEGMRASAPFSSAKQSKRTHFSRSLRQESELHLAASKALGAVGRPRIGQRPSNDVNSFSWPGQNWKQV